MDNFFEQPILNSPYEIPTRHWALDAQRQPVQIVNGRRRADFINPIPKPARQMATGNLFRSKKAKDLSTEEQTYDDNKLINDIRTAVGKWRAIQDQGQWKVTPTTARLLLHWRKHRFNGIRPFFCQIEAAEIVIWLTEVAPEYAEGQRFLQQIAQANREANKELFRIALKLATGAGKTTVMAMLIAWQTVNAVRHPGLKKFTKGFLVVAPGITIKDRLRVLMPNDPDSYYADRELVPTDLLPDVRQAKIVITNFHAFKPRNRDDMPDSKGTQNLLQGGHEAPPDVVEPEGQTLRRVMDDLMGMKNIMVINDEAHHCYRRKDGTTDDAEDEALKGEERDEADRNDEMARLWISGLEMVQRTLGINRVVDLSATPFFLQGSGYKEGTLFPWTVSDFSLMDAIECGIVKLPRVPIAENIAADVMPMFRNLWKHIGKKMPKKGRAKQGVLDPQELPPLFLTALEALYGNYREVFELWRAENIEVPPCFIIVCNNTASSKLVYDYISGYHREDAHGDRHFIPGKLELFRNFDEHGNALKRPRTLLIDSEQLESGDKLDEAFRTAAAAEIEQFKRDIKERGGRLASDLHKGKELDDATLLREVMNTVGKKNTLGADIRCVVSVSMLTEGWDANTVTHILGVRAFGTQLLCEQVVGRALRRMSYEADKDTGLFAAEYADVFGIPFDFTAKPTIAKPTKPPKVTRVSAVKALEKELQIRFPRVQGYRVDPPAEAFLASFTDDHHLRITPEMVGPTITRNAGIIGKPVDMTLKHLDVRTSTVVFELTTHLLQHFYLDGDQKPKLELFGALKRIVREWVETCLHCEGGTQIGMLKYQFLADEACKLIAGGITNAARDKYPVRAILDPYNPEGSTRHVNFTTTKTDFWDTGHGRKCHIDKVVLDSGWEAEFCRVLESHPSVLAYVKNHNLGFEVPYTYQGHPHAYRPDFIVYLDDGRGADDPLKVVVEVKGQRDDQDREKARTMRELWLPGVMQLGGQGRWAFAELRNQYEMELDFENQIKSHTHRMIDICLGKKEQS